MRVCTCVVIVCFSVVFAAVSAAQQALTTLPVPREAAIEALEPPPIEATPEALAVYEGSYRRGGGYGNTRLQIQIDGDFSLTRSGCTSSRRFRGRVRIQDGDLFLTTSTVSDLRGEDGPVASDENFGPFVPVTWGDRLYLLEHQELDEFSAAVNAGSEPSGSEWRQTFMMRDGDWKRPVEGLPRLPASRGRDVLAEPLVGHVVAVDPDGRAVIDLGSRCGVRPGMGLMLQMQRNDDWAVAEGAPWYFSWRATVVEVEQDSCVLETKGGARRGQLVTARYPEDEPLPPGVWRTGGDDPRLSFDPLPPLSGTTADELDRLTARVKTTFSPGVPCERRLPPHEVDALTPAFLNALRGLDMSDEEDVRSASTILQVFRTYQSRCVTPRLIDLEFVVDRTRDADFAIAARIWQVETFVMWWREVSADPERLAAFQRGQPR